MIGWDERERRRQQHPDLARELQEAAAEISSPGAGNRAQRRAEEKQRGRPNRWIPIQSPKMSKLGSGGWLGEMDRAWVDHHRNYVVMARRIRTAWGEVTHAAIRNADSTDIPWAEKQRIKNELFGSRSTAIEVFPPAADLVDEAMMYHVWILHDQRLPFGLMDEADRYRDSSPGDPKKAE